MFKYGTSAHCVTWVSEFGNRAICIWSSAWVAMWTSDSWGGWYANCGSSFPAGACTWMSEPAYSNYIWWSSDRLLAPGSWGLSFCLSKSAPFGHISLICMSSEIAKIADCWICWSPHLECKLRVFLFFSLPVCCRVIGMQTWHCMLFKTSYWRSSSTRCNPCFWIGIWNLHGQLQGNYQPPCP